jgi:hypothetical protein
MLGGFRDAVVGLGNLGHDFGDDFGDDRGH